MLKVCGGMCPYGQPAYDAYVQTKQIHSHPSTML